MNDEVTGKKMNTIIDQVILTYGLETAPTVIDKIKRSDTSMQLFLVQHGTSTQLRFLKKKEFS
jgi:hypothetical protein